MKQAFWQDKSVFLTGHTGFKGSWFSLWLQQLGAEVSGYALEPNEGQATWFHEACSGPGLISTIADVRDGERLTQAMINSRPEVAFHFAAQPLVRQSYANPAETYAVNVMGTVNFLEAVRRTDSVKVAVVITSDKCYENVGTQGSLNEDVRMGGSDPYSSSKGCAELVISSYRRSFFGDGKVVLASARAGNVIGGGDWSTDRLLPDMVRAFASGETLTLRYPRAVRPWQHVLEPLRGYLMLAEKAWTGSPLFATGWNFGPGDGDTWSVEEVVQHGASLWGSDPEWKTAEGPHLHEAGFLQLDCTRAQEVLDWDPVLPLVMGIDWTVAWYRAAHINSGGKDQAANLRSVTLAQIKQYQLLVEAQNRLLNRAEM